MGSQGPLYPTYHLIKACSIRDPLKPADGPIQMRNDPGFIPITAAYGAPDDIFMKAHFNDDGTTELILFKDFKETNNNPINVPSGATNIQITVTFRAKYSGNVNNPQVANSSLYFNYAGGHTINDPITTPWTTTAANYTKTGTWGRTWVNSDFNGLELGFECDLYTSLSGNQFVDAEVDSIWLNISWT